MPIVKSSMEVLSGPSEVLGLASSGFKALNLPL